MDPFMFLFPVSGIGKKPDNQGYNAKNGSLGMEISGGFTLMPTAQGTVAPGLGLSLRF